MRGDASHCHLDTTLPPLATKIEAAGKRADVGEGNQKRLFPIGRAWHIISRQKYCSSSSPVILYSEMLGEVQAILRHRHIGIS